MSTTLKPAERDPLQGRACAWSWNWERRTIAAMRLGRVGAVAPDALESTPSRRGVDLAAGGDGVRPCATHEHITSMSRGQGRVVDGETWESFTPPARTTRRTASSPPSAAAGMNSKLRPRSMISQKSLVSTRSSSLADRLQPVRGSPAMSCGDPPRLLFLADHEVVGGELDLRLAHALEPGSCAAARGWSSSRNCSSSASSSRELELVRELAERADVVGDGLGHERRASCS